MIFLCNELWETIFTYIPTIKIHRVTICKGKCCGFFHECKFYFDIKNLEYKLKWTPNLITIKLKQARLNLHFRKEIERHKNFIINKNCCKFYELTLCNSWATWKIIWKKI